MLKSVIPFLLLFAGCATHPKEGEWYTKMGSERRLQVINIGTGQHLLDLFYRLHKVDTSYYDIRTGKILGRHTVLPSEDSSWENRSQKCVMLMESNVASRSDITLSMININIVPARKLERDYVRMK